MSNFKKIIGGRIKFNKYFMIFIFIFFLLVTGSTYAYFAFQEEDSVAIKGNIVSIDADLDVELVVGTDEEMVPLLDDALSNAIKGTGSTNGACVDSVGNLSCQVYKITLINNGSRLKNLTGSIELYPKEGTDNAYSNLKWRELSNTTTIKEGSVVNGMSKSTLVSNLTMESKEVRTWYIAVWISEVDSDQRETDKGDFGGTVTFEVGSGSSGTKATDYIINKYNDGSAITTVNIAGATSKPQVHLNATQGIMLDNNGDYRYYGSNPNNYVSYNDELWRIISVGNVKANENDTVGETRVKIVKADILTAKETGTNNDITAFSYNSDASNINTGYGVNDWSKSDLMTELNILYYNSRSGTCYTDANNTSKSCDFTNTGLSQEARNLTSDALYYLGGSSSNQGLYANDYYNFERGTTVWGSSSGQICNDGSCPRATTWTGRVGIIYPSDYMYATDLSLCKSDGFYYNIDTNCSEKDWLWSSSNQLWTISPYSSDAYTAFLVYSVGLVSNAYTVIQNAVRPVQYLKANVAIVGGEGTTEKPYKLSIGETTTVSDKVNAPNLDSGNLIPVYYDETTTASDGTLGVWKKADSTNANNSWYDYDNKMWANAVMISDNTKRATYQSATVGTLITESDISAFLVWIPRFKYRVWNITRQAGLENTYAYSAYTNGIEIVWESGDASTGNVTCSYNVSNNSPATTLSDQCSVNGTNITPESGNTNFTDAWYTHPAFKFNNSNKTGFWIGKFETTGTASSPTVLPDNVALTGQNVSTQFTTSRVFQTYGLSNNVNAHMLTNLEWGAVAYLTHSIYGLCNGTSCRDAYMNNSRGMYTGRSAGVLAPSSLSSTYGTYGTYNYKGYPINSSTGSPTGTKDISKVASTTGNITGVYDMVGGSYEYVMANQANSYGDFQTGSAGNSWDGSTTPSTFYYNPYSYGETYKDQTAFNRAYLGDGTAEATGGVGTKRDAWQPGTGITGSYSYFVDPNYPWFLRGGFYISTFSGSFFFNSDAGIENGNISFRLSIS